MLLIFVDNLVMELNVFEREFYTWNCTEVLAKLSMKLNSISHIIHGNNKLQPCQCESHFRSEI